MSDDRITSEDRAKAIAASLGCQWCHGEGMFEVFHQEYRGKRVVDLVDSEGKPYRVPGVIAAHCDCAMGQWMRKSVSDEIRRRTPTIAIVSEGRTSYQLWDPTEQPPPPEIKGMTPREAFAWLQRAKAKVSKPIDKKLDPSHEKQLPDSRLSPDVAR